MTDMKTNTHKVSSKWWYRSAALSIMVILSTLILFTGIFLGNVSRMLMYAILLFWFVVGCPIAFGYILGRCRAIWTNNNAMYFTK